MNPRQVAIETAARYDTNNPFEIARERNIRILHQPLKTTLGFMYGIAESRTSF